MTTQPSSRTDTKLSFRWWQELAKNPPDSPLWDAHTSAVALTLRGFADPDGTNIRPTLARVARIAGCTPDTVSDRRKRLVTLGMIEEVTSARTGRATVYRLCEPERWRKNVETTSEPEPQPSGPGGMSDVDLLAAIDALASKPEMANFYAAHRERLHANPELLEALKVRTAQLP
jgi:hypothetical protein